MELGRRNTRMMFYKIMLVYWCMAISGQVEAKAQSNYALQGIDVEYGEGLPQLATLAGKVTELDTLLPEISLNRAMGILNCASGSMDVQLRFKEPFYGIAYSDYDRHSACQTLGTGSLVATLEIPLKGCGTRQDPQRVFTNNVIVRFHPGLEMEGDEVITIVCRYPPPIVPAPPARIFLPPAVTPPLVAPLKEFEVLLIICAILFLGLMLIGLGCSYYCLKQRNIQVVRKRPFTPEESVSSIESFSALKIPRVNAPSSGSSEPLEEILASDYPSSIEDAPQRPDTVSSEYSDTHVQIETEIVPPIHRPHFPLRTAKPDELSTFSEREGSITSIEEGITALSSHIPDLHAPPTKRAPPPIFTRTEDIRPERSLKTLETLAHQTIIDREELERETRTYAPPVPVQPRKPEITVHNIDDVYLQTIIEKRLIEDEEVTTRAVTKYYKKAPPPPPPPQRWETIVTTTEKIEEERIDEEHWEKMSEGTDVASVGWSAIEEPPIRPHYSVIDRESIHRHTDITHDTSDQTTITRAKQRLRIDGTDTRIWTSKWERMWSILEEPPRPGDNDFPGPSGGRGPSGRPSGGPYDDTYRRTSTSETSFILNSEDRERWRQIITTESTLRTLLTEATVREDYERIRRDPRYENLFTSEKWEVIIRALAPTDEPFEPFFSDNGSEISSSISASKAIRRYKRRKSQAISEATSATDVRSMTELMVSDYARHGHDDDNSSVVSSIPGQGPRSTADRSQTEIVEYAPDFDDDDDDDGELGDFADRQVTSHTEHTEEVDDDGGVVKQSTSSRTVVSSSRLTRF